MLLEATNLTKSFGERTLFSGASFKIEAGEKVGIIGANGSGKTTLFNIISGNEEPSGGGIVKAKGVTVGFLSQFACSGSTRTCYDEAVQVFSHLIRLEAELEDMHTLLEKNPTPDLIEKEQLKREAFQTAGGLTYKSRTRAALIGIGFTNEELDFSVSALSGGQRSKIELCKLLLSAPDIMLLDEPTNHLDIEAIEWLDSFLVASKSAAVIISHDRYFLDRVVNKIFALEYGKITTYNGNYTKYLAVKEQCEEAVKREYQNSMREVHRIEGIIKQQRQWTREKNIKTAESKQKQIDRILKELQIPESEIPNITLSFKAEGHCSNTVLTLNGAEKRFDNKTLYSGVSLTLMRGERVLMLGANGCGKTTLIKEIKNGLGRLGIGVTVGYFDQHGNTLNPNKTIFQQLSDTFPQKSNTEIRSALALFLFRGEDVFKEISTLSGGEKARVALCELMLKKDNFLLLDEPTNHLDLASREVLESALDDYDGTILAVSHDRYFINRLADRILYFKNQTLLEHRGNYDDYISSLALEDKTQNEKKTAGAGGTAYKQAKEEAARQRKLKTQLQKTEAEIEELEARQNSLEEQLTLPEIISNYQKLGEINSQLEEVKEELLKALELWEELSNQIT
ncbi:MAG: ABC-F family ATP-binding cassette domain-containing protein [Clostridia bacterium]|nr:ABC-F family ATP-binding cassette domain-containing protein [Clostridia bacterium]